MSVSRIADVFKFLRVACIAAVACSSAETCFSQVIGFMPGDSYFRVELPRTITQVLPRDGGDVEFTYSHTPCLCGFAGLFRLRVEGVSRQKVLDIQSAFALLQDYKRPGLRTAPMEAPKASVPSAQANRSENAAAGNKESPPPLSLFVYSASCNWNSQDIGLKYNQSWAHLPAAAFGDRKQQKDAKEGFLGPVISARAEVYDPLIPTYQAVVEDWRGAGNFPSLNLKPPRKAVWGLVADEPIMTPVMVKSGEVQFLVTLNDFLGYFNKEDGARFYAISESGLFQMTWVCPGTVPRLNIKKIDP